jgi:prevent-host-death family protein
LIAGRLDAERPDGRLRGHVFNQALIAGLAIWLTRVNLGVFVNVSINAKQLRGSLPDVVERVRKGTRFTVIYRSRPAFQIVPVNETERVAETLAEDSLYRASAVGRSRDGKTASDHDALLYGR